MKRIINTLSQKWPEYLLEILVITIGILGAFALNNWNENRKETQSEKRFLVNLKNEVTANQVSLGDNIQFHKNIYKNIIRFMALTGPDAIEINQSTFDSLVYSTIRLPNYDPVKENITSDRLDDLEADQLKAFIAKWVIVVEDYDRAVKITYDLYYNFIYPELSKHYPMKDMKGFMNQFNLKSQFSVNQKDLLRNLTFENHLIMRAINAKNIYERALEIHELQEKIIHEINRKLAKL